MQDSLMNQKDFNFYFPGEKKISASLLLFSCGPSRKVDKSKRDYFPLSLNSKFLGKLFKVEKDTSERVDTKDTHIYSYNNNAF
jgi:hypothetical protein